MRTDKQNKQGSSAEQPILSPCIGGFMELYYIIGFCILFLIILIFSFFIGKYYSKHSRITEMDEMEGVDFEKFCADLLSQRGFDEIELTKASGDYGIDILAQKEGVTYAIQCKRYSEPVGVKAVQEAYAGRDYYDRMVGAVMTNQYFTASAVEAAKKLKILLWDRGYVESMLEETRQNEKQR